MRYRKQYGWHVSTTPEKHGLSETNAHLIRANRLNDNEFYTRREDFAEEFENGGYAEHFHGKRVYIPCMCDNDQIWGYMQDNAGRLGLESLIGLKYNPGNCGVLYVLKNGRTDMKVLEGDDGDYAGPVSLDIMSNHCDIVVTNPPFHGGTEALIGMCLSHGLQYLILGPHYTWQNSAMRGRKASGELRFGSGRGKKMSFGRPDGSDKKVNVTWYTNIIAEPKVDFPYELEPYDENSDYEFDYTGKYLIARRLRDIPDGYDGIIAVPMTYMNAPDEDEFEIVSHHASSLRYKNGKRMYRPMLIKRKIPGS